MVQERKRAEHHGQGPQMKTRRDDRTKELSYIAATDAGPLWGGLLDFQHYMGCIGFWVTGVMLFGVVKFFALRDIIIAVLRTFSCLYKPNFMKKASKIIIWFFIL